MRRRSSSIRAFVLAASPVWVLLCVQSACVETAECDVNIPCPSGQACHQPRGSDSPGFCKRSCETEEDCGEGLGCFCTGDNCDDEETNDSPHVKVCTEPDVCEPKCDDDETDGTEDCLEGRCQARAVNPG